MALKQTGVELIAEGSARFLSDIGKADKSIAGLGTTAEKVAKGGFASLGKAVLNVGKVIGGLALGGAVAGIGALSAALVTGIGDAREAAKINAQTEQTIKSMGNAAGVTSQHVQDFAASLSAANGMSLFGDSQYQESTNLLLTFQNIKGATLDLATTLTGDLAQALGGAPADQALMLGKALDNPTQGMSALRRVGLAFTEDQVKQVTAMQATGDMAGAQALIIAELNKQVGGSAAAAAAADGGFAQFRDRMGELAESVGAKVMPALNGLMGWLNSPEVQGAITAFVDGLVNGFTSVWNAVQLLRTGDFSGGIFGLNEDHPMIVTLIKIHDSAVAVRDAFNEWSAFGTEWGIVAALEEIGKQFPVVQPLTDWLKTIAPEAVKTARNAFVDFRAFIRDEAIPQFKEWITWLQENLPKAAKDFRQSINEDVLPVLRVMNDVLNKQSTEDLPKATSGWQTFEKGATTAMKATERAILDLGQSAHDGLINMYLDGVVWQTQWGATLVLWVADFKQSVINVGVEMALLPGTIKSAVGDLGTLLYAAGQAVIQGLINGMNSMLDRIRGIRDEIIRIINSIPGVPNIPTGSGGGSGFGGKSISPPASPGQLAQANSYTTMSTVQYNYAPTYGATPNNPSQDFAIMQVLAR